jgi:hypothetical protein
MHECVDGEYQTFRAMNGAYIRKEFFGKYPELLKLVEHMTDDEIWACAAAATIPSRSTTPTSARIEPPASRPCHPREDRERLRLGEPPKAA